MAILNTHDKISPAEIKWAIIQRNVKYDMTILDGYEDCVQCGICCVKFEIYEARIQRIFCINLKTATDILLTLVDHTLVVQNSTATKLH